MQFSDSYEEDRPWTSADDLESNEVVVVKIASGDKFSLSATDSKHVFVTTWTEGDGISSDSLKVPGDVVAMDGSNGYASILVRVALTDCNTAEDAGQDLDEDLDRKKPAKTPNKNIITSADEDSDKIQYMSRKTKSDEDRKKSADTSMENRKTPKKKVNPLSKAEKLANVQKQWGKA